MRPPLDSTADREGTPEGAAAHRSARLDAHERLRGRRPSVRNHHLVLRLAAHAVRHHGPRRAPVAREQQPRRLGSDPCDGEVVALASVRERARDVVAIDVEHHEIPAQYRLARVDRADGEVRETVPREIAKLAAA